MRRDLIPKRIDIDSARAIVLYNLARGTTIELAEELYDALGHGRTSGPIRVLDLNDEERKKLAGANFFNDSMKHPPVWGDSCCLLGAVKWATEFWIGEC